jgi:hypothetical protein
MSTRLKILFNGGPDDDLRTLLKITDSEYRDIPGTLLYRWKAAERKSNTWALEVDAQPIDGVRLIFILPTDTTLPVDWADALDSVTESAIPIVLGKYSATRDKEKACVDRCDRVYVVNSDGIDPSTQKIIDYAVEQGKQVAYMKY